MSCTQQSDTRIYRGKRRTDESDTLDTGNNETSDVLIDSGWVSVDGRGRFKDNRVIHGSRETPSAP
jgi:hypothetical protein